MRHSSFPARSFHPCTEIAGDSGCQASTAASKFIGRTVTERHDNAVCEAAAVGLAPNGRCRARAVAGSIVMRMWWVRLGPVDWGRTGLCASCVRGAARWEIHTAWERRRS